MAPRRPHRWLVMLLALVAGCGGVTLGGVHVSVRSAHEHESRCARAVMGRDSPYRMPLADPVHDDASLALLAQLPEEARRTARAAGLEPLLVQLLQARDEQPPSNQALQRYHELVLRMAAFDAQTQSLAFELGCTREHLAHLVDTLDSEESSRQFKLAAASLVIGASTGTVAGALDLAGSPTRAAVWIAVLGGVATAGFGAAALLVPERGVVLEHARNLLQPVLEGGDPEHLYPSFVFRMLTARFTEGESVPRDALLADLDRILQTRVPSPMHPHAGALLAGRGGLYPRELLEARKALLHAVELSVAGVARDLELFGRTMVRLFATPPAEHPEGWP